MRRVESHKDHAQEVQQVAGVENTLGDIGKVRVGTQIAEKTQQCFGQEKEHLVHHGQKETDGKTDDEGNDLIPCQGRGKQTDGTIRSRQQAGPDIPAYNGPQSRSPKKEIVKGKEIVGTSIMAMKTDPARNLPSTTCRMVTGMVNKSS